MVILLKTLSFTIWLIIMIALIIGSRRPYPAASNKVTLVLEDDDDVEMKLKQAIWHLSKKDRLVILDKISSKRVERYLIIKRLINKNSSIIYYTPQENI